MLFKKSKLKPKHSLWGTSIYRRAHWFYGDYDKDGVINGFDCAPRNPRKQGEEHENNDKEEKFSDWANRKVPFDEKKSRELGIRRAKELTEELIERRKLT